MVQKFIFEVCMVFFAHVISKINKLILIYRLYKMYFPVVFFKHKRDKANKPQKLTHIKNV